MAGAEEVRALTGYSVAGCAGRHSTPMPVYLDRDLMRYESSTRRRHAERRLPRPA